MPKRQNVKKVKSEAVQGEDSWVEIRKPTVKEARGMVGQDGSAAMTIMVLGWNWVDENGDPLPQPKDDPAIIELLTADEINFINEALTGDKKN